MKAGVLGRLRRRSPKTAGPCGPAVFVLTRGPPGPPNPSTSVPDRQTLRQTNSAHWMIARRRTASRSWRTTGRRSRGITQRPNLVIVLTRTELESTFPAPMCWRSHARITPEIEGVMNLHRGLLGLADATQQLHLGMPSMQAERHELFAKARRAEGSRSESAAAVAPGERSLSV